MKIQTKGNLTWLGIAGTILFAALGLFIAARGGWMIAAGVPLLCLAAACVIYARTEEAGKGITLPQFKGWQWAAVTVAGILAVGFVVRVFEERQEREDLETLMQVQEASLKESRKQYEEWRAKMDQ